MFIQGGLKNAVLKTTVERDYLKIKKNSAYAAVTLDVIITYTAEEKLELVHLRWERNVQTAG